MCLFLYSATLLHLFVRFKFFCEIHIKSSVNSDNFASSYFPTQMSSISFSCLFAQVSTSSTSLKHSRVYSIAHLLQNAITSLIY